MRATRAEFNAPLTAEQQKLVEKSYRLAFSFINRMSANPHKREVVEMLGYDEAISICFDGIMRASRRWREDGGAAFSNYAWNAMRIRFNSAVRHELARRRCGKPDGMLVRLTDENASLIADPKAQPPADRTQRETLRRVLRRLPSEVRRAVKGYYLRGLTDLQVSETLGVTKQCVNYWRHDGIRALRRIIGGDAELSHELLGV